MQIHLPSGAVFMLFLAACAGPESRTATEPSRELVDIDQRIAAEAVNAHVYGSFVIPGAAGPVTILSGPANFPGNPPGGPGSCVEGLWYNSKGKPTAGSLAHPHPHCVTNGSSVTVVLEPISAQFDHDPRATAQLCFAGQLICRYLSFSDPNFLTLSVVSGETIKPLTPYTKGSGTVVGYAIDASTLNAANTRVGTITFDLAQYSAPGTNLFESCEVPLGGVVFNCLPVVIDATFEPLAVGGVGNLQAITGFLWWAGADLPYNY